MQINIDCSISYDVKNQADIIFQLLPAFTPHQTVQREDLQLPGGSAVPNLNPANGTRLVRTRLDPGIFDVRYQAVVEINRPQHDPATVEEMSFANIPAEVLPFLLPSRFCEADTFTDFAEAQFGGLQPGFGRVNAICEWVHGHLAYTPGSTTATTSAADVFNSKSGVCRDFAHLAISLCRASGIPARYCSVYADALDPPDFHAVVQAYLGGPDGGAWYVLDPTHMSSSDATVRIGVGRDAADVAFAWTMAPVESKPPVVKVTAPARQGNLRTTAAVVAD